MAMKFAAPKRYPVLIEKGSHGYGATFPDFPGCTSAGDSLEETFINAHEALAGHVASMAEAGDEIPEPSTLADLSIDPEVDLAAVMFVGLTRPGLPKKVGVSIDAVLLQEIDSLGADRSQFLTDAARVELARRQAAWVL